MDLLNRMGKKSLLALVMALILVIAAGCQAVGGVDFNQMLKQSLKVTSMEGNQSIEFQLMLTEDATAGLPENAAAMMELFSNIKLQLNDIKMKNAGNMSFAGQLSLGEQSIGFSLKMTESLAIVEIEGASRAFRLDMTDASLGGLLPIADLQPAAAVDSGSKEQLTELGHQVIDHVGGYLIDNLLNPSRLTVKPVQETINGESLHLFHVQAEIDGTELLGWVKSYLDALIGDREGLAAMLTGLVEVLSQEPELLESIGFPVDEELLNEPSDEIIREGIDDFIVVLEDLKGKLEILEEEEAESLAITLNNNTYLKTDLYVDSKLDIRKSVMEAVIRPDLSKLDEEAAMDMPFEGIVIRSTSESWNVNGDVTPGKPVIKSDDITLEELVEMESYEIVRLFDPESVVYGTLKKMGLTKQTVIMHPVYELNPPIVTPRGITLIPLRDTVTDLGGSISYNGSTKEYTVNDRAAGSMLVLKKDSKQVKVNNGTTTWSFPVTNIGGTLYVPARDFMTSIGGTVKWEAYYMDEKILLLEREL